VNKGLNNVINNAQRYLSRLRNGAAWHFPVVSKCELTTALSLNVFDGEKKSKAIDYLMNVKVWEKNLPAAAIMAIALNSAGEVKLSEKILNEIRNEIKKKEPKKNEKDIQRRLEKILWNVKLWYPYNLNEKKISKIPIYTLLFKYTHEELWYSRLSYFYDFFPSVAPMLVSKNDEELNKKIIDVLSKALNEDGSYGGITSHAISAIYVFHQLGATELEAKCYAHLEKLINADGSLPPQTYQDVYDTAWICLAFATLGYDVSDILKWLDDTRVSNGYPYTSGSYFPDPDDTSLILLIKKQLGNLTDRDYRSVDFLLNSQNSDGGWSYCPLRSRLSYSLALRAVAILLNGLGFLTTPHRRGYGFLSSVQPHNNHRSTIDVTARTLITLSYFSENNEVKKKVEKGVKYLLKQYKNGRFQAHRPWTFSGIYENSMALIALFKNGFKNEKTNLAMEWMLNQEIKYVEDAAHVLWALLEGDYDKSYADKMVKIIYQRQLPDGSWKFNVGFWNRAKYYSLFSIASPLYSLALYKKRYNISK
jgi:squalene cyclase